MSALSRYFRHRSMLDRYTRAIRRPLRLQKVAANASQLLTAIQPVTNSIEQQTYFGAFNMIDIPDFVGRFLGIDFDLAELIDEDNYKEEITITIDESQKIKYIITDIYNDNTKLLQIEPRQFEELVAELLHFEGYDVELTKQTRDNGFDIIAIKKIDNFFPLKFLVECKRHTSNIGVDIIRSFKNVIDESNANRGIIAATSYFTRDAVKKKELYPYLLEFKDRDDIFCWIKKYYLEKFA